MMMRFTMRFRSFLCTPAMPRVGSVIPMLATHIQTLAQSFLRRAVNRVRPRNLPHITPFGRLAGTFGTVSLAVFWVTGWHELLMVAVPTLMALAAAMVMPIGRNGITADLEADTGHAAQGHDVSIRLAVQSPVSFPHASPLVLHIGGIPHSVPVPPLAAGVTHQVDLKLNAPPRSQLTVGPLSLRHTGPFGLSTRDRQLCPTGTIYIHPHTVALPHAPSRYRHDLDGNERPDAMDEGLSFHGLRPYVPGDDVRGMHWLSTARTGTPMVRQYDRTQHALSVMRFEATATEYSGRDEFELAVSAFASVGVHCLERQDSLSVGIRPGGTPSASALPAGIPPADSATGQIAVRERLPFLNLCSGIVPSARAASQPASQSTSQSVSSSSALQGQVALYCHVVGSRHDLPALRKRVTALYPRSLCVIIVAHEGAESSVDFRPGVATITVGTLDQLPRLWKEAV